MLNVNQGSYNGVAQSTMQKVNLRAKAAQSMKPTPAPAARPKPKPVSPAQKNANTLGSILHGLGKVQKSGHP